MRQNRRAGGRIAPRAVRWLAALGLASLVAGLAWAARTEQSDSQREVERRFEDRVALAGQNVSAYLDDLADRQLTYARRQLASPSVDPSTFEAAAMSFGFEAAVLLDDGGRVLSVAPHDPAVVGTELASRYAHLTAGVEGRDAVSDVVLSAVQRTPIVAVAVPFETLQGRRVFSGGYDIGDSPLAAFLASTSTLGGRQAHLVDGKGDIVASTESSAASTLAEQAPALAGLDLGTEVASLAGEAHVAVTTEVAGTAWRLVAAVPRRELHVPGSSRSTWLLTGFSAALSVAVLWLLHQSARQNRRLDALARTDALTGLANRGEAVHVLDRLAAAAVRSGRPFAVAMVDVDHFKAVNDRYGHAEGDAVLRRVAAALSGATRDADLVARWGGEEFLVVMGDTDDAGALLTAERLVDTVRRLRPEPSVTISVGTAAAVTAVPDELVARADHALYEAKAGGRDQVVAATPSDVSTLLPD
jgi:diguanylate cyclase (GGDEF)-like protein